MFISKELSDAVTKGLLPDPWNKDWSQVPEAFGSGNAVELEVGEFLYSLVRSIKPKVVVETGTHRGYSTLMIATAIKTNKNGHLYSVDIADYGVQNTLSKFGLSEYATFYKGDSVLALKWLGGQMKFDLVWLDADHDTSFVLREFEAVKGNLNNGSVIVFHDTISDPRERVAVDEIRRMNPSWEHMHLKTARGLDMLRVVY